MLEKVTYILFGVLLGVLLSLNFTFYKVNCDIHKFGPTWYSAEEFNSRPFECLNSNVRVEREIKTETILRLIKLKLFY